MRVLLFIVFPIFCATAQIAFAETGVIAGHIIDGKSLQPLRGASISIEETKLGAIADSLGKFTINAIPAGNHKLTASLLGYKKQSLQAHVSPRDTTVTKFVLQEDVLLFSTVSVEADRPYTAASSSMLRAIDFELRPKNSAQDLLRLVPGLVIAQHAGGGKAEQIFLRGFDADHGTDVNISVDGMPVNMVSHGHGQGYADLHFVIPETVQGIEVEKGPYCAQYGDFATAGSVLFKTNDYLENNTVKMEGGSFGAYRTLMMLQVPIASTQTSSYIAAELFHTDGYFHTSQDFSRYNVFGKVRTELSGQSSLALTVSGFGSSWNASGQIPERAVSEGIIDRFGSIDNSEGGTTQRQNLNVQYTSAVSNGDAVLQAQAYFTNYRFRLFSDFTFFKEDPVNGDEIEQDDARSIMGIKGNLTLHNVLGEIPSYTTFGTSVRADNTHVQLWHTREQKRLNPKADADVHEQTVGVYANQEFVLSRELRMEIGIRGDYFLFDVKNHLPDSVSGGRSGFTGQTIVSPKCNLVYAPMNELQFFFNAGSGFHSNDARAVVIDTTRGALPRALGAEVGMRFHLFENSLITSVAVWGLDLDQEFIYIGDEGTTEPGGRTRRIGVDVDTRLQILPWLWADAGFYISRGRSKDAPEGQNYIPLAPTFTSTGGITAFHSSGLEGSLRYRHVSDRPANEDNSITAHGYTVLDASIAYHASFYRIGLHVENLLNTRWNEAQFDTESQLRGELSPVSELHYTPGTPIALRTSLSFFF